MQIAKKMTKHSNENTIKKILRYINVSKIVLCGCESENTFVFS